MKSDKEFDDYLNNLDPKDQMALNAYMDNLDLENNSELDEYLDRIENVKKQQDYYEPQPSKLQSYIELEPQIESFQDYSTSGISKINEEVKAVNPLEVSLLDTEYEAPVVDTIRYKGDDDSNEVNYAAPVENAAKDTGASDSENAKLIAETLGMSAAKSGYDINRELYDNVAYVDNSPLEKKTKKKKNGGKVPVALIVLIMALIIGGGAFAVYHFSDGFKDFAFVDGIFGKKEEPTTEAVTEATTEEVTTEEATTEEPKGPYATVDYTLHKPHTTDSTIVYNSNAFSLRYPKEEWPIFRNDNGDQRDATQEELYPSITLEARDGSLNSTSPNPDNIPETQMLTSRYMVLVDLSDDSIVAKRDSDVVVNPASMTKILTVLTAADLVKDLDDTFIMTDEAIRYAYDNGGSAVGFIAGEKVTVRDLIYGTIVCSGADAAVGLAQYCCGTHEAFVEKMNEKAEELGISDTAHFTNVVGMYDENLHCTMEDMAVIMSTAMQNELLKEVLNTRIYQTTPDPSILPEDVRKEHGITVNETGDAQEEGASPNTEATAGEDQSADNTSEGGTTSTDGETTEEIDPGVLLIATEGIQISNWFMRRIEDKDTGGEVLGAKTGFVNAAGFCCASYYKSKSGKEYVCVTGDTYSSWRCIYDHVGIYRSLAN